MGLDKYNGASMHLPDPEEVPDIDDPRHCAVALKFDKTRKRLIVTYLSHGVVYVHVCWLDYTTNHGIYVGAGT